MKRTDQTMANYEEVKPVIEKMMLDHNLTMAQLSIRIGKGTSYISNLSRFGLADSAKKQLLLLLQGISNRGVIANDLLKHEMELTKNLKEDVVRLERELEKTKLKDIAIKNLLDRIEKDKLNYKNNVELAFLAGVFLIINFIGFFHAIIVISTGDVHFSDIFLGCTNLLCVFFLVCILDDILTDLN